MNTPTESNREKRRVSKLDIENWNALIVDDQKDNLMIAREALRFHGVTVETANNALDGLAILDHFEATLILLDLSMPDMSGWDMFEVLKQNPKTRHIPVIALTAHVMAGDEERVMAVGFDGYIAKPFSVAKIIQNIQAILDTITQSDTA